MSRPYSRAVSENHPEVAIVFDRYHIMAQMNLAMESLRREQQRTMDKSKQQFLKGCRFLLLSNDTSLSHDRQTRLNNLGRYQQTIIYHVLHDRAATPVMAASFPQAGKELLRTMVR